MSQRKSSTSSESPSPSSKRKRGKNDEGAGSSSPRKLLVTTMTISEEDNLKLQLELVSRRNCAVSPNMGLTWFRELRNEFRKEYFDSLHEIIENDRRTSAVYPPIDLVYAWTTFAPIYDTKVVILGHEPYHDPNQANGLAYSVQKGQRIPPALENIYVELTKDIEGFVQPTHGDLSGWARQGVLLLNTTLTVKTGIANSHVGYGWDEFTDAVIRWLSHNLNNLVFLLWGLHANRKKSIIDNTRHLVLKASHPAPRSVQGFIGMKQFSQTNAYLEAHGKTPIVWGDLPFHEDE